MGTPFLPQARYRARNLELTIAHPNLPWGAQAMGRTASSSTQGARVLSPSSPRAHHGAHSLELTMRCAAASLPCLTMRCTIVSSLPHARNTVCTIAPSSPRARHGALDLELPSLALKAHLLVHQPGSSPTTPSTNLSQGSSNGLIEVGVWASIVDL
ncbi:hypothetical protein Salat_1043200 [Sesamum alatum]|uniref:Uncharacterized protein n=1 Tax=Sesamum alatum TaxID=300844 RepID=A0AAE1YLU5_9LAMI|nr:hypothetical protein Salat_1043200 [Sesamum alatum]